MAPDPGSPEYQNQLARARSKDVGVRSELAAALDAAPELLVFLAADMAKEVRKQIAENETAPGQADLLLADDRDEDVRRRLLDKVVKRVPGNDEDDPAPLQKFTLDVLTKLADDPSGAVRQALSDALQDSAHAPYSVVRRLAFDVDLTVAAPMLTHSPILGEQDLLAAVADAPATGAKSAIARRDGLPCIAADALARSRDATAIAVLLENRSAQIREETLDLILDQAPEQPSWHRPLVDRRDLSRGAVERLARFVAISLVEVLRDRPGLDPSTAGSVARLLKSRIEAEPLGLEEASGACADDSDRDETEEDENAGRSPAELADIRRAHRLVEDGLMTVDLIDDAIFDGNHTFVVAAVGAMAGVDDALADRILRSQSARGVVALAWSARLPIAMAIKLQMQLARLPKDRVLGNRDSEEYPLTEDEMLWQLEFFGAKN